MKSYSIYIDREDVKVVEDEEKNMFVKNILDEIGIDYQKVWPTKTLNVKQKVKLRKLFEDFDIDILEHGKELLVYVGDDLIAEWKTPKYILRTDPKARRANKRMYYEMIVTYWTLFDDEVEGDDEDE